MQTKKEELFPLTAIISNELSLNIPCVQFYKMCNASFTTPPDKPPLQNRKVLRHRLRMPHVQLKGAWPVMDRASATTASHPGLFRQVFESQQFQS